MKFFIIIMLCFFYRTTNVIGQTFNKSINKDSLLQVILNKVQEDKRSEILKIYNDGNEQEKEFLLFMFSMPASSKKELIANIDSNFTNINYLKTEYSKLVPKEYTVYIEFNPADKIAMTKESIDLRIESISNTQSFKQEWNLEYHSTKLSQMLKPLNWTAKTIMTIKKLLLDANCVSIENGEITTIGFARSGMGKYFYKLLMMTLPAKKLNSIMMAAPLSIIKKISYWSMVVVR